jgi:hypothetical protein
VSGLIGRAASVLALVFLLGACIFVDGVSYVTFNGSDYQGGPSTCFRIDNSELVRAGAAEGVQANVRGTEAFALRGVDVQAVIVMRSGTPDAPYWIFFREGVAPGDEPFTEAIPELCQYAAEPDKECQ